MTRLFAKCFIVATSFWASCGEAIQHEARRSDTSSAEQKTDAKIIPAAERMNEYLPILKGKRVAVFANHTSLVNNTNLVDTLVKSGVQVVMIFGPEHGFRGTADAGEKIGNYADEKTGIAVVSLYGSKRKPSAEDLKNVDIMLFDIQDVGTRFYTYISSLEEYMEAAIENNKPVIVLDRPNPNGFYVDGPVLDTAFRSFVGMQRIPIVYGMTIGEYAKMLVGEKWLSKEPGPQLLTVIPCAGYTHQSKYALPVRPSPNLPDMSSIYWYPSTCWFEGTILSEGRGTDKPFQLFGHPSLPKNLISFTPRSMPGATNPKLKDQLCYGWDISGSPEEVLKKTGGKIQLKYILDAYRLFPDKDSFFRSNGSFNRLAGNDVLMQQIKKGLSEEEIRKSWEPALSEFKQRRKKYLLYADF
jgi:uncharacterized protein YbbC (DUF1343 family)